MQTFNEKCESFKKELARMSEYLMSLQHDTHADESIPDKSGIIDNLTFARKNVEGSIAYMDLAIKAFIGDDGSISTPNAIE